MEPQTMIEVLREGGAVKFPTNAQNLEYAQRLDKNDPLKGLRDEFKIPTKASLKRKFRSLQDSPVKDGEAENGNVRCQTNGANQPTMDRSLITNRTHDDEVETPCLYFCGNSLGCQPKLVSSYLQAHLDTWADHGVNGHFATFDESPLTAWQDMAEACAKKTAPIVGADATEVVIMNTLTANLHLMMASFYKPTQQRHKIICEWKPFPSDYFAIESHIQWHNLDPAESMILLHPEDNLIIPTEKVFRAIDEHAESAALLLLPGIQYYTGQLFDIATITAYAQQCGIVVGWDLAHAAGNVPLQLHDWKVDFAVWCTYKYMNAGPGSIAGAFVHSRHGNVKYTNENEKPEFQHRLAGWYGGDKKYRFLMDNTLRPTPGAGGFQLSNPSIVDLASLSAALEVFNQTNMLMLRDKSLLLTAYAEFLLYQILGRDRGSEAAFTIITPKDPLQRGAQLSVLLRGGLLDRVGKHFKQAGVVCDQRKPDVIRVAPVPLYNSFEDVWRFMDVLERAVVEQ